MQRRVLIADDNPAVRKTLRHLLEESGSYEVADSEDGQSALVRAIEFHPDVVILDLAMPVMDGLSARPRDFPSPPGSCHSHVHHALVVAAGVGGEKMRGANAGFQSPEHNSADSGAGNIGSQGPRISSLSDGFKSHE